MRKPLIAGNWKMNGTRSSIQELVSELVAYRDYRTEVLVCPPSVFLDQVSLALADSPVEVGAQNVDWRDSGAFTGEISALMLKDFGCSYVLIGHSERRALFGESDEVVALKFRSVLNAGMVPILCVGESLEDRQEHRTLQVVASQLLPVLDQLSPFELAGLVIAYEPVWAIGTGETATPEMAADVHREIRHLVHERDATAGEQTRVLYAGSVNAGNAAELLAEEEIDGALVGGASLKGSDFIAICEAAGPGK